MAAAPPSWSFDTLPNHFVCSVDLNQHTGTPIQVTPTNLICEQCFLSELKPKFTAAIQNEHNYPVRFGPHALSPQTFSQYVSPEFLANYAEKEKEYSTPTADRVYCANSACATFLGSRIGGEATRLCACGARTNTAQVAPTTDPLEGLQRGRDYQLCPGCSVAIELASACNHIICSRCNTSSCYCCGLPVAPHGSHWMPGGCPRYTNRETGNVMYDDEAPGAEAMPALLAQAMNALDANREPQAPAPVVQQPQPPVVDEDDAPNPFGNPADRLRRVMGGMGRDLGFTPTRARGRGRGHGRR